MRPLRPGRTARDQWREALLGSGPGWTIRVSRWRAGGADVSVTAETAELATEVLRLATKDAAPPPEPDAGIDGRLLLLHGAPGTGKTTVLRTLAREWRAWCQADCVLDAENLFEDPGYLMDVVLGGEERRKKTIHAGGCWCLRTATS